MARFTEPTPAQEAEWNEWVASRPECVRKIAERFEPWSLYQMKNTGQRCTIVSFSEDGTIKVAITGEFNAVMFEREVFGISPDNLVPCDLPGANEIVGFLLSDDEVKENIDALRGMVKAQRR